MTETVTILIVDDDALNREMLAVMLEGVAETICAADGRQALDLISFHPEIDLILLDLQMPVLDGFEVLRQVKADPLRRDIPVIVTTACRDEVVHTLSMGASDFLAKPLNAEELRLRAMNHVRNKKMGDLNRGLNLVLEKEVALKTTALQKALDSSREAEYEITLRLARAAEFRDVETGMHTRRISEMAHVLGELAGLSPEACDVLRYAAPMHDVGKVGIPDQILLKPGKLTEQEFQIMQMHTVIGGNILTHAERYPVLETGRIIALQHHERWDGTGYPEGLSGENIHLNARIVAIADVFDALCSRRPYKPPFPLDESLAIMREGNGTFFDPELLELFLNNVDRFVRIRHQLEDRVLADSSLSHLIHEAGHPWALPEFALPAV